MSQPLFRLTTLAEEGVPIEIDGVEYELRTIEQLSAAEEARLRVLAKREQKLSAKFDATESEEEMLKIAEQLRNVRIEMIQMMTNIPEDVINRLSVFAQAQILRAIGQTRDQLFAGSGVDTEQPG